MVDDDFVAAVGAKRGLYSLRNGTACFNIANDGTVFGFVAVRVLVKKPKRWIADGLGTSNSLA